MNTITNKDRMEMFKGCTKEDQLRFFLQTIFPKAGGFIELRFISPEKTIQRFYSSINDIIAEWHHIQEINKTGFNIYFGVCQRTSRSGRSDAVKEVSVLWADIDDPAYKLEKASPMPDIVIASGRGFHLYWLLSSPIPANGKTRMILKGLQKHVKSDTVHDFARVLRMPFTTNWKNGKACQVLQFSNNRQPASIFDQFAIAAADVPPIELNLSGDIADIDVDAIGLPPNLIQMIKIKRENGQRSENDMRTLITLVSKGLSDLQIFSIFMKYPIGDKSRKQKGYFEHSLRKAKAYVKNNEF